MKIKKFAHQKKLATEGGGLRDQDPPAWINNTDANLMRPKDVKAMQEEMIELK